MVSVLGDFEMDDRILLRKRVRMPRKEYTKYHAS